MNNSLYLIKKKKTSLYAHFHNQTSSPQNFYRSYWDLLSKLTTLMTNILLLLNIIISYKYVMETYNLFLSKPTAFGRDFGIMKEEQKLVVLFCRDYHNWGIWCWNMLGILFWSQDVYLAGAFKFNFSFLTFIKYKYTSSTLLAKCFQ